MLIDGKLIASQIQDQLKQAIAKIIGRKPCLAVIQIGNHPASSIYVSRKITACTQVGIISIKKHFPESISSDELRHEIETLNIDPAVDGILIQLPLPSHISPVAVTQWVSPEKDVDGFHPLNMGKLLIGDLSGFVPCTPLGIKHLILSTGESVPGKHAVVIGRSNIVGKPIAALLMQNDPQLNATVTLTHSLTKNLKDICLTADILIAAIGKPKFITEDMVKEGAIVIDVGINRLDDTEAKNGYRLVGDVDFNEVQHKAKHITPVPMGVGPMTIAMLLSNTWQSFQNSQIR